MPFPAFTRRQAIRLLGLAGLGFLAATPATAGPVLDPTAFDSLGFFKGAAGGYQLDTGALTLARIDGSGPVYQGVSHDGVAVFAFDGFELLDGSWIAGTGSAPVAILSRSDMIISGTIDVGTSLHMGGDGPGGFDATGPGGSLNPGSGGSGGGGHGGAGGRGGRHIDHSGYTAAGTLGGSAYGELDTWLAGGSGSYSGATKGGGAIELGAAGTISIPGLITAAGGSAWSQNGGGAAGGGVRIHASAIELSTTGVSIDVSGGHGAPAQSLGRFGLYEGGGGGGGGRVLLMANEFTLSDISVNLAGGSGYEAGEAGRLDLRYASVPEPSSFLLAGLAAAPALLARRLLVRR